VNSGESRRSAGDGCADIRLTLCMRGVSSTISLSASLLLLLLLLLLIGGGFIVLLLLL
jgi:hypothetical protein